MTIQRKIFISTLLVVYLQGNAQKLVTPFEKSGGRETATYFECINFYRQLKNSSSKINISEKGLSDAGYPYHVVLYSNDGKFDPALWHKQNKIVILIINGIHAGEPDGIDASMLLLRDINNGKVRVPDNVALAIIPIYNIGGALNRNSYSRVNQNGPPSYGFRGNAQDLDLNRDFTKNDSRDARSFVQLFHWLNPDIQVDNHVSDGADYQHTMTLITTQWNKLGGETGKFVHDVFDPALFSSMGKKGWPMCPYVNFEEGNIENGWEAFNDSPRYSSGYAALFHTLSFIPETHMLKPFKDRVQATYELMITVMQEGSAKAKEIIEKRKRDIADDQQKNQFALGWKTDSSRFDTFLFKGYTASFMASEVTGKQRLFYDHARPFEKEIKFYNYFTGDQMVTAPKAYLIPQGWHEIIDLLKSNGVGMRQLLKDSMMEVEVYHIDSYLSSVQAYEKHHRNTEVHISASKQTIRFLKGDYIIYTNQPSKRFLVEMLEPTGDDSYFSWNFFDAILQQKEGYSDYRWEDIAAAYLKDHAELKNKLEERKKADPAFTQDASAQLDFIYKNSPYYEPEHRRYPVYRVGSRE